MKQIISYGLLFLAVLAISFGFSNKEEEGNIHLKVTKEENGEKTVLEKVYVDMEELKADEGLMAFDIMVSDWMDNHSKGIIIEKRIDSDKKLTWINEDANNEEIIEVVKKKVVKNKKDGEEKIYTITSEGEGQHHIIWVDEDGNEKKLAEENIDKTAQDRESVEVNKKIKVMTSEKKDKGENVSIMGSNDVVEIDITVEKEVDDDGNEGIKQTMNINIQEKDGKKYIEIDIKREAPPNVSISEIQKNDISLQDAKVNFRNNLKTSQLNYYPNPNNGKFNLRFSLSSNEELTVKVIDILGNEVYKEKLLDFQGVYDNEINLKGKEKGIYILQISQKKKALTRKILIE